VISAKDYTTTASYERSARVALVTDDGDTGSIPAQVRAAADFVSAEKLKPLVTGNPPEGADAMILWFAGEQLKQGNTAAIRRALAGGPTRIFIPVHLPCIEELDLISLQPRIVTAGATSDHLLQNVRVASPLAPSETVREAIRENSEPWAQLHLALLAEQANPGNGIEELERLGHDRNWQSVLGSLLQRDLIVLYIRHDRKQNARELLQEGIKELPNYAELFYIQALLAAGEKSVAAVVEHLKRATKCSDPSRVGSGGESTYRAHWLFASALEPGGEQGTILGHCMAGLFARPAFEPSVVGILQQRVSVDAAYNLRLQLCPLVRREPRYFEAVFCFLLLHRQLESASRLLRLVSMPEEARAKFLKMYDSVAATYSPRSARAAKPGVVLTGPFLTISSLSRANRELAVELMSDLKLQTSLEPHGLATRPSGYFRAGKLFEKGLYSRPEHCDLTIRHHWPPDFRPPPCGKLIAMIPWEYGSVPVRWVRGIEENVFELWVPSKFVRDVFVSGGVADGRVQIIPYGVDIVTYRPEGNRFRPEGSRRFVFLFVGGVIERKGPDLLAEAYECAFSSRDDVTLIIKDQGSASFYHQQSLLRIFEKLSKKRGAPHAIVVKKEMSDEGLASLYRGCDAFVLPYRGEGFGMPLAEALACGKPVITTGLGPAREFCPEDASYFIRAEEAPMREPPVHMGPLTGRCNWFEPDVRHLAETMRYIYDHRDEVTRKAAVASQRIRETHNWKRVLGLCRDRIHALLDSPVSRRREPESVHGRT
jgi:glycosyltransferase involved in cell wall biosynthesis